MSGGGGSVSRSRTVSCRACCVRCCSSGGSGGANNYAVVELPAVAALLYFNNTGAPRFALLGDLYAVVNVHQKARLNPNGGPESVLADEPCLRSGGHHHHCHHYKSSKWSEELVHPENKILLVL